MAISRRGTRSAGASDAQPVSGLAADDEERYGPRKTLFLSAMVSVGNDLSPIRIRNLSESGAQIEGETLPDVGTSVRIERGPLHVGATIVWRAHSGAGIHFDEPLALENWLPKPSAQGQLIVDEKVQQVRSGMVQPISYRPAPRLPRIERDTLSARLAEELAYVSRLIEQLGDVLAGDPLVVMRYPDALQSVDLSTQIIRHVAALIVAEDPDEVIGAIGIESLRNRLLRGSL